MRNRIFWGAVLIILGLIFLFSYQLGFSIWNMILAVCSYCGWQLGSPDPCSLTGDGNHQR